MNSKNDITLLVLNPLCVIQAVEYFTIHTTWHARICVIEHERERETEQREMERERAHCLHGV